MKLFRGLLELVLLLATVVGVIALAVAINTGGGMSDREMEIFARCFLAWLVALGLTAVLDPNAEPFGKERGRRR